MSEIDRWLSVLGICCTILAMWLSKTPTTAIVSLVIIFLVLVHPILNSPWIKKSKVRPVIAIVLLVGGLYLIGRFGMWPQAQTSNGLLISLALGLKIVAFCLLIGSGVLVGAYFHKRKQRARPWIMTERKLIDGHFYDPGDGAPPGHERRPYTTQDWRSGSIGVAYLAKANAFNQAANLFRNAFVATQQQLLDALRDDENWWNVSPKGAALANQKQEALRFEAYLDGDMRFRFRAAWKDYEESVIDESKVFETHPPVNTSPHNLTKSICEGWLSRIDALLEFAKPMPVTLSPTHSTLH